MIKFLYTIKAFKSKALAESGKVKPEYVSQTGSYQTAKHIAESLKKEYGCCLVVNNETGNPTWFH